MLKYCICIVLQIYIAYFAFISISLDMLFDMIPFSKFSIIIRFIIYLLIGLFMLVIVLNKIASVIYSWGDRCIVTFIKCSFCALILLFYIRYIFFLNVDITIKGEAYIFDTVLHSYFAFLVVLALLIPIKNESTMKFPLPIKFASIFFYIFTFAILSLIIYANTEDITSNFNNIWIIPSFVFISVSLPVPLFIVFLKIKYREQKYMRIRAKDNYSIKRHITNGNCTPPEGG